MSESVVPPSLPAHARAPHAEPALLQILAFALTLTAAGDFLFWDLPVGVSLAVFVVLLLALLLLRLPRGGWTRTAAISAALLLGACVATAVEISFTNVTVLLALLAILLGEIHFRSLPGGWPRAAESLVACLAAPARWVWLARAAGASAALRSGSAASAGGWLKRWAAILLPALLLLVLFAVVFATGNAVLSEFLRRGFTQLVAWLLHIDISFGRLVLWLLLATFALAWLRPCAGPAKPRGWTQAPSRWQRREPAVAFWQSVAVLAGLNALFFAVNTIDVAYLWARAELPAGVNPRAFLHEGVGSVITAVLLSAAVLSAIFQQENVVTRSRLLKNLAYAWIAQNFVLIAGVFLRLKLYVDHGGLTEKRIYVACFLGLVMAGFLFLSQHVMRGGELGRLLRRNALAALVLFYVVQFVDVVGIAAHFNVSRWEHEPARGIDVPYQASLGPAAWPALARVARHIDSPFGAEARARLEESARDEQRRLAQLDWRSWQARRDRLARWLVRTIDPVPAG